MSSEYIQTNSQTTHETATTFNNGDRVDTRTNTSEHVIPYDELQARREVIDAVAQSIERERPLLPHEVAAQNTQNLVTMRGYDLAA